MSVRDPSTAVTVMGGDWPMISALLSGTSAMRAAKHTFLPQWPNEDNTSYDTRLKVATLFPAFSRTVDVLTGKPFSKPITLDHDVPPRIREWTADIDLQGRDLHAFAGATCYSALAYGMTGILVDFPPARDVRTAADERAAGLRPYFVEIKAQSLLGWRAERINGAKALTQLRFLETVTEPDGEFGDNVVTQVRVLYPGAWSVYREDPKVPGKWVLFDEGKTTLNKIPFVPIYGCRTAFMQCEPPLAEMAYLNVEHWQSKSDQQNILHVARVPILFGKKLGDTGITVGAGSAVIADDPNADLKFVEHSGKAIEAGRVDLLDLEDRMRQVGAELLVIKPGNTSVTQTRSDNEPGMCALQRIIQDQEQALGKALDLMAEWVGIEAENKVSIYQDFGVSSLAEASAELLLKMKVDGSITHKTLLSETMRRGILAPELDIDAEIIAANKEAAARSEAAMQRQERLNV